MSDKEKKAVDSEEKKEEKAAKTAKKEKKTKAADSGKSKKEKEKKSIFKRIATWFKDLKKEFKKVVWPTKRTVFNNTLVVLCVVVIGSAVIGALDYGFLHLMEFLMNLSN
jgi:preprotein translocase subunit SecE